MQVRGAFNHLLRPGLRRDFRDSYDQYPEEYSQILRVGSQDRAEVEALNVAGLPRMPSRGEQEPVTYIDGVQGSKVIYIDTEYALGMQVSQRLIEDDLYNRANQNAKWLGRSTRLTQEYQAAALLDDAFTGAVFTGMNGEAMITTSHLLINSASTGANRLATDVQIGITGMQAMYDLMERTLDETGDPIPIMPDTVVVSVADSWVAAQINDSQLEPFTQDNQVNPILARKGTARAIVAHYKTQNNDWFMRDTGLHDAHFLFRVRPQFRDTFDFDTIAAKYWARQRINVYFFDWRGWGGSKP